MKNNQTEKEDGIFQLSPIQSRSRIELMKSNTFHRAFYKVVLSKANVNDASQNAQMDDLTMADIYCQNSATK